MILRDLFKSEILNINIIFADEKPGNPHEYAAKIDSIKISGNAAKASLDFDTLDAGYSVPLDYIGSAVFFVEKRHYLWLNPKIHAAFEYIDGEPVRSYSY